MSQEAYLLGERRVKIVTVVPERPVLEERIGIDDGEKHSISPRACSRHLAVLVGTSS
jgi:hypothetical protein